MVGIIAACLTTLASVPQVIKVVKSKDTKAISLGMYTMQVMGVLLWLVHGLMINDIALIGANTITFVLTLIILVYKIKYK
ncbi:MAG: SemiSWEET transporter [Coprobacillaceae bacterium]